jgi:hypothetical protein
MNYPQIKLLMFKQSFLFQPNKCYPFMYRVCFFSSSTNQCSTLLIISSLEPTLPHLTVRYHPMSTKEHPAIMDPPHSPSYRYALRRQLYRYVPKRHRLVQLYQSVETFHKHGSSTKVARDPDLSSADASRTWHVLTAVIDRVNA